MASETSAPRRGAPRPRLRSARAARSAQAGSAAQAGEEGQPPPGSPLSFEQRLLLLALASVAPATVAAVLLIWLRPWSATVRWTLAVFLVLLSTNLALRLRERVVRPLQTVANLLSALREGDFSLRAPRPRASDALAQVHFEVNAIGETMREQRLGAVEAAALLHRVVEEVDVAVFAFDHRRQLRLVNRAGFTKWRRTGNVRPPSWRHASGGAPHRWGRAPQIARLGIAQVGGGGPTRLPGVSARRGFARVAA